MKIMLTLILTLAGASAQARSCPNFAGEYELTGASSKVHLKIIQVKCSRVETYYTNETQSSQFTKIYLADGKSRKTFESDDMYVIETEKFLGDSLIDYVDFHDKKTNAVEHAAGVFHYDSGGVLLSDSDTVNADGHLTVDNSWKYVRQ